MTIKISPTDGRAPSGRLAEAELRFTDGPLEGLKLIGFAIWQRGNGDRYVTFPARQYSVSGERRTFALLRPTMASYAQERLREVILGAYEMHTEQLAEAETDR